ncbi:hypothetical protein PR048_013270 [Dryococelus australis]|uniref:Uncharacterized protein n=1 Tax=Dryococelus australis TaxID=614101 RepID=A0ABQ9HRN7_9NEOP|nr:hypothetical protein PR048_013270 [Dryococelus australis]
MADEKKEAGATVSTCILAPPASLDFRRPDEWGSWFKRFQSELLKKSSKIQISTLIYILGQESEDIINSFNLSDEESTSYEAVVKRFESYFISKRNVIYERVKFNLNSQLADESVHTFVTALHSSAEKCKYKSMRNELIRDIEVQMEENVLGAVGHLLKSTWSDVQPSEKAVEFAKIQVILGKFVGKGKIHTYRKLTSQDNPFKIDTGADVMVVLEQVFDSRYSASNLEIKPGLNEPILGRSAINFLGIFQWVEEVNQLRNKFNPLEMYPKLFKDLGLMAATYKIRLKNDAVPVSLHAPRRVALPLQPKLKQDIDRLVNMGIISPVDRPTEWCSGTVIVPKRNGQMRLCRPYSSQHKCPNRAYNLTSR